MTTRYFSCKIVILFYESLIQTTRDVQQYQPKSTINYIVQFMYSANSHCFSSQGT